MSWLDDATQEGLGQGTFEGFLSHGILISEAEKILKEGTYSSPSTAYERGVVKGILSNGFIRRKFGFLWLERTDKPIPDGLWVLHRCDNPACVNPDHLFLGTCKDNVRDKVSKGRARGAGRGEAHWKNTLTKDQVIAIMADERTQSAIAADYGVRPQAVSKIKLKQTWAHLWSN